MASPSIIFHFIINLSDIDRGLYINLDFRAAQHPSESMQYFLTRILAYLLNYQDGLSFSPLGLGDPDTPCLSISDDRGGKQLWVEIGNPSPRQLHKAAKAANKVRVYTYKNPTSLLRAIQAETVHRSKEIEIYSLTAEFLEELSDLLSRESRWSITISEETLMLSSGTKAVQGELRRHYV